MRPPHKSRAKEVAATHQIVKSTPPREVTAASPPTGLSRRSPRPVATNHEPRTTSHEPRSQGAPMQKSRSELVFDHAIKHATPFSTTLGHAWIIVPDGHTRCFGWPIFSRRF